jgi:transposase
MAGMWVEVPEMLWREIEPLIPVPERRFRYPGRKRHSERSCLEGILTVLRWGIPWRELPRQPGGPSGNTCWRRFDEWQKAGVWPQLLERLQQRLSNGNRINWERAIVDATIVPAKRGAPESAETLPIAAVRPARSTCAATVAARR